jgi:hypothetical protein
MIQDSSPITPPRELVYRLQDLGNLDAIELAYQAGADQELEACCEWLHSSLPGYDKHYADYLRAARRPKPPSLKELALEAFNKLEHLFDGYGHDGPTIRHALESLPD